jgi:hypothetical protein
VKEDFQKIIKGKLKMNLKNWYWEKIKHPLQSFRNKKKYIKTQIWEWDIVNLSEVVFDIFKMFVNNNNKDFVNQYILETEERKDPRFSFNDSDSDFDIYLELEDIKNYVLYTRETNRKVFDNLCSCCYDMFDLAGEIKMNYDLIVDWEKDYDTLVIHSAKKMPVNLTKSNYPLLDIEEFLEKIDRRIASRIVELSGYLWD